MEIEWDNDEPDASSGPKRKTVWEDDDPVDVPETEAPQPVEPVSRPARASKSPKPKGGLSTRAKLGIVFAIGAGSLLLLVVIGVALMSSGGGGFINLDPSANFSFSADNALTNEVIEMDASDSKDTDGDIVAYHWDFDSDGTVDNTTEEDEVKYVFTDDGEYTVTLEVEDNGGAVDSTTRTITISNRAPEVLITCSHTDAVTYEVVTYTTDVLDADGEIASCSWDFDGDGSTDWSSSTGGRMDLIYQYPQDGMYKAVFTAEDDDGAETKSEHIISIQNQPPIIDITLTRDTFFTYEPVNISVSVDDLDGSIERIDIDYEGDGKVDETTKTIKFSHEYTDDGEYTLTFLAVDDDGGIGTKTVDLTILNRAPVAKIGIGSITAPYSIITYQEVLFFADVNDIDGKLADHRWDFNGDGTWDFTDTQSPNSTYFFTDDGTFTSRFMTTDDDGAATVQTLEVTVNNQAPSVEFSADMTETTTYEAVTFSAEADDPDGTVSSYEWDFDGDGYTDYGPTSSSVMEHTYTEDGKYDATVKVTDNDGASTESSIEITILNSVPQGTIKTMNTATTNQDLHLVAEASDIDGTVVKYEWDFDGDTIFDTATSYHEAFHRFTTEGQRIINLKVTDDDGGFSYAQKTVDILYNNAPVADAGADVTVAIGEYATIDASNSSDAEGDDLLYYYDFNNDGTFEIEDSVNTQAQTQYGTNGTYTVCVKVFDGEKYSTDTVSVNVLSPVNRWAILIGISDYPGSGNDLSYCDDDANDWETYLTGKGYTCKKLIDSQGTWSNVQNQVNNWLKVNSDENDIVVFTYSGHGVYYSGDSQMCLYDGDRSASSISNLMSGLAYDRLFYFFDCCNSGSFKDNLGGSDVYVAEGCRTDEYTVDDPSLTNGGFTYYFLNDGLRSHGSWSAEDAFDNAYTRCVSRYGFHPQESDGNAGAEFYF